MADYRLMLLFPNLAERAVLSGGAWAANRPLDNLKTRHVSHYAETSDLAPASTQLTATLPRAAMLQAAAVVGINCSTPEHGMATSRLEVRDEGGVVTYDSGEVPVWGAFHSTAHLDWEDPNWFDGAPIEEDLERRATWPLIHVLPERAAAKTVTLTFSDPDNPAGVLRLGRLWLASGFRFANNYSEGATTGMENDTRVAVTPSGAEHFDVRDGYIVFRFAVEDLDDAEAFGRALDFVRRAGLDREVLVVPDPTDTLNLQRRSFVGRLRRLSPIEQAASGRNNTAWEIKESQG